MTRNQIFKIIKKSTKELKICNVFLQYDHNYWNLIPLKCSNMLFLSAQEDDFILNGYTIRRVEDVTNVRIKNDKCNKILEFEGIKDKLEIPSIRIDDWKIAFEDLILLEKNIIVETESLDEDERDYVIGRIEKVFKQFVYVRHFDADGIWHDEPYKIPYSKITSVTFLSRYVTIFSKYLDELPDNFAKQ